MHIIPVIDLLDGTVVHAKRGARANYQPIKSLLTASSKPLDIVTALLDLHPFTQLYIADLNAIQKLSGNNFEVIAAIAARFPKLELWLDADFSHIDDLKNWRHLNVRPILGSENFAHLDDYLAIKDKHVLSLDFMPASQQQSGFQGSLELLENAQIWPQDVIVMTLANVGTNQGANGELLQEILNRAAGKNVYAAGGVRGLGDLIALKNMGIHGALVATALHELQISADVIKSLGP